MAFTDYEQKTDELKLANTVYFNKVKGLFTLLFARLNNHIEAKGNVHALTKEDIGLGDVANYAPANDVVAAAGTNNTTLVTPLQVATYVATNVHTPLAQTFLDAANEL